MGVRGNNEGKNRASDGYSLSVKGGGTECMCLRTYDSKGEHEANAVHQCNETAQAIEGGSKWGVDI